MNRRDFLRFVGTGLVVGPAAVKAILVTSAESVPTSPLFGGQLGVWSGIRWHVKEFDFGNQLGVALSLTNPQTGEQVRNAVRLALPNAEWPSYRTFMHEFIERGTHPYDGIDSLPADLPDSVLAARRLLEMWAEEESYRQRLVPAPAWWREETTAGVRGDAILEGNEMQA